MTKRKTQTRRSDRPLGSSVWLRPARPGEGRQVEKLLVWDPVTGKALRSSVDADRADGTDTSHGLVLVAADRHRDEQIVGVAAAGVPRQLIAGLQLPAEANRLLVRSIIGITGIAVMAETVQHGLVGRLLSGMAKHYRQAGFQWVFGQCRMGNDAWLTHLRGLGFTVGAAGVDIRLNSALWPHNSTIRTQTDLHAFFQPLTEEPSVRMAMMPVPSGINRTPVAV
ncbi:hypothetical protein JOF53_002417 [Crossiella equi]|uniref:N-acetyltransferase domain-containing protein n=1 Tax=Crossiella equi TaxID=130796 RepID=A0ABS5ACW9_9PSEU|nr:hypothetical protein [Crossiella equi]MBP2473545.1 hypothetical protein [Crossiella equi]